MIHANKIRLEKLANGNVLIKNENNQVMNSLKPTLNVLLHPTIGDGIILSPDSDARDIPIGFFFNFEKLDRAGSTPAIVSNDISGTIRELSTHFFFEEEIEIPEDKHLGNSDLVIDSNGRILRMQPANSTTLGLRIQNGNSIDVLVLDGRGNVKMGGNDYLGSFTKVFSINSSDYSKLELNNSYGAKGLIALPRRRYTEIGAFRDNAFEFSHKSFNDGNAMTYKHHYVNPSAYYFYPGIERCKDAGFMWFKDSATPENLQHAIKPDNAIEHYKNAGLTEPRRKSVQNGFVFFADETNGVTHPSFYDSNENKLKIMKQDLPANPTNEQLATFFANIGWANLI